VFLTAENRTLTVVATKAKEDSLLVKFAEIDDRNESEALGRIDLYIDAEARRALGDEEYWPDELVGLEARDSSGSTLGHVVDIDDSTPQARLVIETAHGRRLVPLVTPLVPQISLDQGFLVVSPVEGLLGPSD
jgi:16S rRNA processing protein RimM